MNARSNRTTTLSLWIMQRSWRVERAANSEILRADVMAMRKAILKDRNFKETSRRGSKGDLVRAERTLGRSHVGNRWTTGGQRLEVPLRKFQMSRCLETVSEDPQVRMEEIAATCRQRVLGARPDVKPSCRKSKMFRMETEVGIRFRRLHQLEKDCHMAL